MKKKIILTIIVLILILLDIYLIFNFIYLKYKNKLYIEKNDVLLAEELHSSPYKIDKVLLYSSASAKNKNTNFQKSNWILDIYQYTDIAIYLNCNSVPINLSISNINFKYDNSKFNPKLYYANPNHFGTGDILENFEINDKLDFSILNFENADNSVKYNTPVFFADSSIPISLKFVNTLSKNTVIENTEKLLLDGHLLSYTNLEENDLNIGISFDINILDNTGEYTTNYEISIPTKNISKGGITSEKKDLNIPFFKISN